MTTDRNPIEALWADLGWRDDMSTNQPQPPTTTDQKNETRFVVSKNIPGYMPMDDEPWTTDDIIEAADALIDDVMSYVEDLSQTEDVEPITVEGSTFDLSDDDTYASTLEGIRLHIIGEIGQQIPFRNLSIWVHRSEDMHDLGLRFWAAETDEPTDEEGMMTL